MKKIRDIMCTSTPYGEMYTDNELNGTVIVDNEHVIGIIVNDGSSYLTFGKLTEYDTELVVSKNYDKELPKLYEGRKNGARNYYGDKSVINRYVKIPIEECRVAVFNPELYRNVEDDEMIKLESEIEKRKKLMGEETKILFEKYFDSNKSKDYML